MTSARHGDDPRADERDGALRHVGVCGKADGRALRLGFVGLRLGPVDERERTPEVPREQLRSERPVKPRAVARPVQVEPRVARHALHRVRLRAGSDVHRTARPREGRNERPEPLFERDPFAVGRRRVLCRVVAANVLDLVASGHRTIGRRHPDAEEHELLVPDVAQIDARAGVVELRRRAAVPHEQRLAAGRRHDVDAGLVPEVRAAYLVAADVPEHDHLPVGRKRRLRVVPPACKRRRGRPSRRPARRARGRNRRRSTSCRQSTDRRGERRIELERAGATSQPPWLTARQRLHIDVAERAVDDRLAVRRRPDVAKHAHRETRRCGPSAESARRRSASARPGR